MMTPELAHAALTSSIARAYDSVSMPAPPYSCGMATPISPSSAILATISAGQRAVLSSSAALGATSRAAKSRAVSRIMRCSSVSSKSMAAAA